MNTSVRGRRDSRGFSFVELLVTIIIAGIAFAAMVPVFVQAQQSNASDNSRNLALGVAQDRIEKIRQLPYDQIVADGTNPSSSPNLYNPSPSFAGGQFGPTATLTTGVGVGRTFSVAYTVDRVPSSAAAGAEQFKKVTVDVWWTGNPKPVKHTILSTFIYRQYSGPQIGSFAISTLTYVPESGDTPEFWYLASKPVTLSAHIDNESINNTGSVLFQVFAHDGTEVLKETVDRTKALVSPAAYSGGTYSTQWNPTGYRDGVYTFRATAYSLGIATPGQPWDVQYDLETGPPTAPEELTATSQSGSVKLTWTPPQASDIVRYELFVAKNGDPYPAVATVSDISPTVALTGYVFAPADLGATYHFKLRAMDENASVPGAFSETSVLMTSASDTTQPSTPSGLTAAKVASAQNINLAWVASTDNVGVVAYNVYRAGSAGAPWPSGWTDVGDAAAVPSPTFSDTTVVWSQTYSYRVAAVDAAGNESNPSASSVAVTVDPQPPVPTMNLIISVNNGTSTDAYVDVKNTDTNTDYGQKKFRKNKTDSNTWTSLPLGNYQLLVYQNAVVVTGKTRVISLSSLLAQPVTFVLP